MSKVIGVLTARMASRRLPGKVMKAVAGKSLLAHHIERLQAVSGLDGIFLATSIDPQNSILIQEAERLGCGWISGSEHDVVERHIALCEREGADAIIRVPCDSPLFNIDILSEFVSLYRQRPRDYMYVSNMTMVQGTSKELVASSALHRVHAQYQGPAVTMNIIEQITDYDALGLEIDSVLCRPEYRLTVDYPEDLHLISSIYDALYKASPLDLCEVYAWLDEHPELAQSNSNVESSLVNKHIAALEATPLYAIQPDRDTYRIVDRQQHDISPEAFLATLYRLVPELAVGKRKSA